MKRLIAFALFLALSSPGFALDDGIVKYIGGTAPGVKPGMVGQLNTTSDSALIFEQSAGKLEIPYAAIQSFDYSKEVTHHLGVLPFIAVSLVRMRQRRHFFRISYRDPNGVPQVVVLEVPKRMPRTLQAILGSRAPSAVKPNNSCGCSCDNGCGF